jgi:hypothetical protein
MPFLHYETDERRQKMSHAIKCVREGRPLTEDSSRDILLVNAYMNRSPPLHPRRTLDQYFYHGIDTTARDTDQYALQFPRRSPGSFTLNGSTYFREPAKLATVIGSY